MVVAPFTGSYEIIADGKNLGVFSVTDIMHVSLEGTALKLKTLDQDYGFFNVVKINGTAPSNNNIKIKPVEPELKSRTYNDDIELKELNGRILILNDVDLEYYVAGTVESEGGPRAESEYYKSQALLCRTYALEKWNRHTYEGFNLCDGVHCQAYKSRCLKNFDILESTLDTKGQVVVDTAMHLITAAYHSNSGGYTENSENVWVLGKSYLKGKKDEFWSKGYNAYWKKEVSVAEWIKYLNGYGFNIPANTSAEAFTFSQSSRKIYYTYGSKKLLLTTIRSDMRFKSTFFEVVPSGANLIFKGRGYGHGVGLAQEGAMEMAKQGYDYKQILEYYYSNIHIVSLDALDFFKEEPDENIPVKENIE
jgi:stage II sporulation protein D